MWTNPYPATYQQQMYPPYQQQTQAMTYPTIHADIIQTGDAGVIERWPVGQDKAQMFIDPEEKRITIKSVTGNTVTLDVFEKRPPAPPEPAPVFMTRDDVETMIAAALSAKRPAKKEAAEE